MVRGLLLALVLPLLLVVVAWGLAHNPWVTQQILPRLPGIEVTGGQGALLGDFQAQRVEVGLPRGGRLVLVEPAWRGMRLNPDLETRWRFGLAVDQLRARELHLTWVAGPTSKQPGGAPQDLSLPLSLRVGRLEVETARSHLWGAAPLERLEASVALQAGLLSPRHRVRLHHLAWSGWQVQGQAEVGVRGTLPLEGALQAALATTEAGQGQGGQGRLAVAVRGALTDLAIQAHGHWRQKGQGEQSLTLSAQVQPFATWPVSRLQARLKGLNLQAFAEAWPATLIGGEVVVQPVQMVSSTQSRRGAPGAQAGAPRLEDLGVQLSLRNERAGSWESHRVPIQAIQGQATIRQAAAVRQVDDLLRAVLWDMHAALPAWSNRAGAQAHLTGRLAPGEVLKLVLDGVEPQALHAQAPPLHLQGEVRLRPDTLAKNEAWRVAGLRTAIEARMTGGFGAAYARPEGARTLRQRSQDVVLALQAHHAPGAWQITRLQLQSGGAEALLNDAVWRYAQTAGPRWQAAGQLTVNQFDPQVWLPWPEGMGGRNVISGSGRVKLDADWRGQAEFRLSPSTLAGVPLQGQGQWTSPADQREMSLEARVEAGGNTVEAQATLPWQAGPEGGVRLSQGAHWRAQVAAPALQALHALAPLLGAERLGGQIQAHLTGSGLWPQLVAQGQITANNLLWQPKVQAGVSLQSMRADWQLDLRRPDGPAQARLALHRLKRGGLGVEDAVVTLDGQARSHQGRLQAVLTRMPASGATADTGNAAQASVAALQTVRVGLGVQGSLQWREAAQAWQGQFRDVLVQLQSAGETTPRAMLSVPTLTAQWRQDAQGERLSLSPAQLNLMGADLQLRKLDWLWPDRQTDRVGAADIQLDLAPFNLPALMNRWQPQAGWGGDLMVTGHLHVRHSVQQPWVVDAAVSRQSGDVTLSEPTIEGNSAQRLGIRDARVTLQARQGVWTLSEWLEGRVLGTLTGRQVVQVRDAQQWPTLADALSGEMDLKVGSLRPLGTWVPAGWRIGGQMQASVRLGGRLGAPEVHGLVQGQNLALTQSLLGVNVTDGQLQMALEGTQILLKSLQARGGPQGGVISAQGEASLGELPQAHLVVKADRFAALQRVDRRVVISGEVQGWLGAEDMRAEGKVRVDEGLIDISKGDAPTIGDDVSVVNRPGQSDEEEQAAIQRSSKSRRKLVAALDVDLGQQLRLKGKGLDARLVGQLKVTTPGNRPALQGVVRVEQGTFAAYGQKLVIDRGTVAFTGPIENPRLDILAMRPQSARATSSDVKVGVSITGTAQDPRVRLYSDPSMSETEKLSWLVLGRAPTGLGGADIGLLQSAAVALLSGESASPSDNLLGLLGLDELSVRQTEGTVRDTVVNVGKQVSRYWYVGYERNLNATGGNWQLIYQIARRFTLRAQAGVDSAVDLIWSWRWD